MRGHGEALDVALGLLRAPALRTALRARPLPGGVGEVLAIASGSADSARSAAERTGYGEAELVEAARFYVQQVLLTEDADAYRVLGAAREADHATLRDHHRMLLRWLHPDRSEGAQWDSALSTRVNQAWNELRGQARRARYDAALPPVPDAAAVAASPLLPSYASRGAPLTVPVGEALPERRSPAAAPVLVGLLGVLCVALAWMAFTREDSFEEFGGADPGEERVVDVAERMAAPLPTVLQGIEVVGPPVVEERGEVAPICPSGIFPRDAGEEGCDLVVAAEADAMGGAATQVEAMESVGMEVAAAELDGMEVEVPVMGLAAPAPAQALAVGVDAGVRMEATARDAAPDKAVTDRVLPAAGTTAPAAPVADAAVIEDPLQLFLEAEDTIRGITAYLVASDGIEPAWLDVPTHLEAAGIRTRLQARHEVRTRARMEIDAPNWTLDTGAASMSAAYRLDVRRNTVETGVLRVDLGRRDRQWRVLGLHLDPAQ